MSESDLGHLKLLLHLAQARFWSLSPERTSEAATTPDPLIRQAPAAATGPSPKGFLEAATTHHTP